MLIILRSMVRINCLEENLDSLQNVVCGYSTVPFQDDGSDVSSIIGWGL